MNHTDRSRTAHDPQEPPSREAARRKAYVPPRLEVHGRVVGVTGEQTFNFGGS